MNAFRYYRRIFQAYLGRGVSQLSFWHETPELNPAAFLPDSDGFYMTFRGKARYAGPFDDKGVPKLDYRGEIGLQYNPIAIAQYALGCFNEYRNTGDVSFRDRFLTAANWLVDHLRTNTSGLRVWQHDFNWEYCRTLKAPWHSGLAQGQGIAVLVRAARETQDSRYLDAADKAFRALVTPLEDGGTLFVDQHGDRWIEEYVVQPPTHILNGFIWALWGVRDYYRLPDADPASRTEADDLWNSGIITLQQNLHRYDCCYWSLYDLAPTQLRNVASPFYHRLHVVQLEVMSRLSGNGIFGEYRDRWNGFLASRGCRVRAFIGKAVFKLLYY